MAENLDTHPVSLTADIVASYVANNSVAAADLPALIQTTYRALVAATRAVEPATPALTPAVSVRKSIHHDYLISLEDGRQYRTLTRHLHGLGLTPDAYRAKWNLPKDYPMVCAAYSEQRSALAKTLGLGRKGRGRASAEPAVSPAEANADNGKISASRGKGTPIRPEDETFT